MPPRLSNLNYFRDLTCNLRPLLIMIACVSAFLFFLARWGFRMRGVHVCKSEPKMSRRRVEHEQCLATICGREVELSVVMQQIFHTPFRLVGVDFALVFSSFHTHLRKARRTYHSQIRSMQVFCKVHIRALTFPQRIRASRSNELCICTCAHKSCKRRCGLLVTFLLKANFCAIV